MSAYGLLTTWNSLLWELTVCLNENFIKWLAVQDLTCSEVRCLMLSFSLPCLCFHANYIFPYVLQICGQKTVTKVMQIPLTIYCLFDFLFLSFFPWCTLIFDQTGLAAPDILENKIYSVFFKKPNRQHNILLLLIGYHTGYNNTGAQIVSENSFKLNE